MPSTVVRTMGEGGVVTLRLNRPEKKNALSPEMASELIELFGEVAFDGSVRVVVVTSPILRVLLTLVQ